MDFENVLFKLEPILSSSSIVQIVQDEELCSRCVSVLDELAVQLRSPANRDIIRESGVLNKLLTLFKDGLQQLVEPDAPTANWLVLAAELTRCIANCVADNDNNRAEFCTIAMESTEIFRVNFPKIFKLTNANTERVSDLQFKSLALIKNFCLDNEIYLRECSHILTIPLVNLLHSRDLEEFDEHALDILVMTTDLLSDFVEFSLSSITPKELLIMASLLAQISPSIKEQLAEEQITNRDTDEGVSEEDSEEADPFLELAQSLAQCIERVVSQNETLDLSSSGSTHELQQLLLQSLGSTESKNAFENKLIMMRRLLFIIGLISANVTNTNVQDQTMCYATLLQPDGLYVKAAALIVLSNSISSRETADQVSSNISLGQIIHVCKEFKDPMQFQGLLDIMKKLLNLTTVYDLTDEDLKLLFAELRICHDQCQLYQDVSPLLDALLSKFAAVCPGSLLLKHFSDPNLKTLIMQRDGIPACILIDKFVVGDRNPAKHILADLWASAFRFQELSKISTPHLFQLLKSLGIYLRSVDGNDTNIVFKQHSSQLVTLLTAVVPMSTNTDSASKSIYNNARFVAGMTLNLLNSEQLTDDEFRLRDLAKQLLAPIES
ncbi:LAQU0S01e05468g1_1 [Lachancea quebecensis]|uniref:LAQU0S01e05468g1_1 n=1 Tax=Lachancea quebecensis TaxID=1654605 RepID=A0A0P1KM01_9SACH|nr:LAQU0S01e05468g1_1 [Lachancea quebecensis]